MSSQVYELRHVPSRGSGTSEGVVADETEGPAPAPGGDVEAFEAQAASPNTTFNIANVHRNRLMRCS
jgi:hypothetical protein